MSHALLAAWAETGRRYGARRAVVQAADGSAVTFRELVERAAAWRAAHVTAPVAGRAVVFAAPNGVGWLEIWLGLLEAGAVVVPLDAGEPVVAQQRVAESLRAGFWWDGSRLVPLAGARRWRDPALCLIKLTSGTTGQPRPLVFSAAQLLADGKQVTSTMGIRARDLNYGLIPFGHSYGLGNLVLPLVAHGVPVVCGSAPLPHAVAVDFARWRPTVFPGVPALWRALVAAGAELPGLRLAISAGAPLPPEVAREFARRFGRRLHSFYGSSETGGIAYDRTGMATLAGGVGTEMRGVKLTLGAGGKLCVASAAVFTHGQPRRRGEFGAWVMPDAVKRDARGGFFLLGRRGATVKIAGRRVNLAEVAARVRRLPGVRDLWVGISPGAEPVLGAAVASDRPVADLRGELMRDTAPWKIPKKLVVRTELPVTARGKVDARALERLVFAIGDAQL
jgi:acyl-coenzyme A synthetase/AMP-(fatty) acid ligase